MTRVLLVDDDRELAELFAGQLTRAGFDAQFADSLASAHDLARAQPPFDVLITDLHLPDADGVQVAAEVKARVTLALTGSSSAADARRLREAGFAAVLVKPLTGKQLVAAVTQSLEASPVTGYERIHILLVEDEDGQQINVRRALDKAGAGNPLSIASDGVEALEMLRAGLVPPRRLVLLDVHMPRMDGLEFLRELRADPVLKPTVVVMLSTSNEEHDRVEAQALNVGGYLLKSADFGKFVEQLRVLHQYWSMMEIP